MAFNKYSHNDDDTDNPPSSPESDGSKYVNLEYWQFGRLRQTLSLVYYSCRSKEKCSNY